MTALHVSATADYALRAVMGLAACYPGSLTAGELARAQQIPKRYLDAIMADLRRAGVVHARRGQHGGYRLAREPDTLTLGDILGGLPKPFADVHGGELEDAGPGAAGAPLPGVWLAAGQALDQVLDRVSVADMAGVDAGSGDNLDFL